MSIAPLRGMTWDHPRGTGPVWAAAATWMEGHLDVPLTWDARPLSAFEDQAISELAADYDLMMIDHPHIGSAVAQQALLNLTEWVPKDFLTDQHEQSVGSSYASYAYAGGQWALAVDAAAQVGAYRADLLSAIGEQVPVTWQDVADLAGRSGNHSARLLLPLNPTHSWCTLLSLAHSLTGGRAQWAEAFELGLQTLSDLLPYLDPRSEQADPIAAGRLATETDEILGIPLAFGYVTFARPALHTRRCLTHVDAPRGDAGYGSVLGGVGLAVSAHSTRPALAVDLAMLIASPEFQCHQFVEAGGQPGHRSAWLDPGIDASAGGFFSSTIASLDSAILRPRHDGAAAVQRRCAGLVHDRVWRATSSTAACARELGQLMAGLNELQERR